MKKNLHFLPLLMAIVMMAMCPQRMWADDVASLTSYGSTTNYSTVEAAFEAANVAGKTSTIKLLADYAYSGSSVYNYVLQATNGNITLDLNGKNLGDNYTYGSVIRIEGANLTIIDSGTGGTVSGGARALDYSTGKLTVRGGTFNGGGFALYAYEAINYSAGDIVISGGKYIKGDNSSIIVPYNYEPQWNLIDFQGKITDENGNEVTLPTNNPQLTTTIIVKQTCNHQAGTGEQEHVCTLCGAVQSQITTKPEWASLSDENGNAIALNSYVWEDTKVIITGTAPEVTGKFFLGYTVTTTSETAVGVSNNSFLMPKSDVTIAPNYMDIPTDPLCFEAKEENVAIKFYKLVSDPKLFYSTDGKQTWQKFTPQSLSDVTLCTLANIGDKVYLAGDITSKSNGDYTNIRCSGKYAATGKLSYILGGATAIPDYGCYYLFIWDKLLTAPDMSDITEIGASGCESMFDKCSSLTTAPDMSSLTTVGKKGCDLMFYKCSNLTTAPDLSKLITVGEDGCAAMFHSCSNLKTAPDLSKLTTVGERGCNFMFYSCSNLNYVKVGLDSWASDATNYWMNGVASTGTFVCPCNLPQTTGASYIPEGWTVSITHNLEKTEAKAATFTEPGNSEYYTCKGCGKYYSDAAAETEIEENSWVIKDVIENFTIDDATTYEASDIFSTKSLTYKRNVTEAQVGKWQALYVPFQMSYDDWSENFDVATIQNFHEYTDDNGDVEKTVLEVRLVKSGKLKANHPYLIRPKAAGENTITLANVTLAKAESSSIVCQSVERKYTFTGTYQPMQNLYTNGYLCIMEDSLKKAESDETTLEAQRWYLAIEDLGGQVENGTPSSNAKAIGISVIGESEATGIEDIKVISTPANGSSASAAGIYDLQGRRQQSIRRGINIIRQADGTMMKVAVK